MKLLRYGPAGQERPALVDRDGIMRDLSGVIPDLNGATVSPEMLQRLASLDAASCLS